MARSTLIRYVLLILCLGAARLPAQQAEMIPPPLPSVFPPDPPDPSTLPPPAQVAWEALPPKDGEEGGGGTVAVIVPPPPLAEVPVAVPSNGECVVQAQFMEGLTQGHVVFYCEGVKTVLPVMRAPLAKVVENELETGGGQ